MYTKKELRAASNIIRQIAKKNNVSKKQIEADMMEAINSGRNNPDPIARARWATFCYAGSEPTVEEFILWVTRIIKAKMPSPLKKDDAFYPHLLQ